MGHGSKSSPVQINLKPLIRKPEFLAMEVA
jgi:hypothetical protein